MTGKTALGIYSDSSALGIDASIYRTDGLDFLSEPVSISRPYPAELRADILSFTTDNLTDTARLKHIDAQITFHAAQIAEELFEKNKEKMPKIDVIGFSGHTVYQRRKDKVAITLGDSEKLSAAFHCPVIDRFIQSDYAAGGQGGPLFPVFLEARSKSVPKPLAHIALRGISTLTYIGPLGDLFAFDVGAGFLLLDHWMQQRGGLEMDYDGQWGAKGNVNKNLLARLLKHPFLSLPPPKIVDKNEFNDLLAQIEGATLAEGAATLSAFIAQSIIAAAPFLPAAPEQWILSGGGSNNPTVMRFLKQGLKAPLHMADEYGWDKMTFGAQAYAFLAVRSLMGLPILFPHTTGVSEAVTAGKIHFPENGAK